MFPTTAEEIQSTIIQEQVRQDFQTPKKILYKRQSQPFKLRDHSPDFFYELSTNDDYKYRRNRDCQKTVESQLIKSPGKITSYHQRTNTEISPIKGEGFFIHNKKINSQQNQKIFHTSHIFDEYQDYPKHKFEQEIIKHNLETNASEISKTNELADIEQEKFLIPEKSRAQKSPVGALSNKLYNSKIQQFPDQDKNEYIQFEIEGNAKIDEVEVRRKLAAKGYQLIFVQLPYQPISNLKKVNGKIQVRVIEMNKDKDIVINEIKGMGFLVKDVKEYYPVKAEKSQKTWMKQKMNYKNIGFFPNRDSDKLKYSPNFNSQQMKSDLFLKSSNTPSSTVKGKQSLGNELHKILKAK